MELEAAAAAAEAEAAVVAPEATPDATSVPAQATATAETAGPADAATLSETFEHYADVGGPASRGEGGGGAGDVSPEDKKRLDDVKARLSGRFNLMGEGFVGPVQAGNFVSNEEFDRLAQVYDKIEQGKGDVRLVGMSGKERGAALEDVARILETQSGRDMLAQLSDNRSKTETDSKGRPVHHMTYIGASEGEGGDIKHIGQPAFENGMDADVEYRPGQVRKMEGTKDGAWPIRSDVDLYHELVHAYHMTRGTMAPGQIADKEANSDADVGKNRYEYQAVGLGDWAPGVLPGDRKLPPAYYGPTENLYRAERNWIASANPEGTGVIQKSGEAPGDADIVRRGTYDPMR